MTEKFPHGHGVYFAREAYAGLGRRIAIVLIDLVVLLLGSLVVTALFVIFISDDIEQSERKYLGALVGWCWVYLVIIEAIWGTVGFWLTSVRIIDRLGKRVSIFRMTFRFLLLLFWPVYLLIDLCWAGGEESRQTLRDKFCGTYVIRKDAQPVGKGPIRVRFYAAFSWFVPLTEIQRNNQPDSLTT